mmetsp:Transcript_8397/g.19259  ORF Transcript_8397/g.19259 Transcript_8397/m.19259 type:complete len:419 (-) Transcript_8397:159-1415(-)
MPPTGVRKRRSTSSAVAILHADQSGDDKNENSSSLLTRMLALVFSFACIALVIKNGTRRRDDLHRTTGMTSPAAKTEPSTRGPSFVTVVLPSVVKPEARPLRLKNIEKTWGPEARAVFVVHENIEFPQGAEIDSGSLSRTFPQVLKLPSDIKVDQGVERLLYSIRTVSETVNPSFIFFTNDHTFVLPNHLCRFLQKRDASKDAYVGHALKGKGTPVAFNSGAAGYVLSRQTYMRLIREMDDPKSECSPSNASKWLQGNPGILTATCFSKVLNVQVEDTRDGEDLSHVYHAYGLVRTVSAKVDQWYVNNHAPLDGILGVDAKYHHRLQQGEACCSENTVSFHYVESGESIAFWKVLQAVLQKPIMNDKEIQTLMEGVWPRDREKLGFYAHGLPGPNDTLWPALVKVVRKIASGVATSTC